MPSYASQESGWGGEPAIGAGASGGLPTGGKGSKNRLFWHSFLGIVLGVSVGGFVLWMLLDDNGSKTTKRPPKRSATRQQPITQKTLDYSKATVRELYRQSRLEASRGEFGPTMKWLHRNRQGFVLWIHLYWQLAQGSLRTKKPLQAAGLFKTLLGQRSYLWSQRVLYWQMAYSYHQAGKKSQAKKLLAKLVRMKETRGKRGWLWRQQDRHAFAEALWLYATMQSGKRRFQLWQRLWLDYPESPRARAAEKNWWREWRKRRPRTKVVLRAIERYIDAYGELDKAKTLLRKTRRKVRGKQQKRTWRSLWVEHGLASADWKEAWKDMKRLTKLKRRSRRGRVYYKMALVAMKLKRTRTLRKTMRKLRRRSRYWYAMALLEQGKRAAARDSSRYAKRLWRKAWGKSRSRELRMLIYLYRGLDKLNGKSRRSARKARSSFKSAARWFRKMRKRDQRTYPIGLTDYWLARAEQLRGKKSKAIRIWKQLFLRAPFSFYGQLSAQRLQSLGQLPPINTKRNAKHIWQPGRGKGKPERILRLLQAEGPAPLLALELEALTLKKRKPSMPLLIYLAQHSKAGPTRSNALLWLHKERDRFLKERVFSRNLLMTAYPLPSKRWPKKLQKARTFGLDSRLVAALLLHKRGFHQDTRNSQRPGPKSAQEDPLWRPTPLNPPRNFASNCKRLRDLLRSSMDVGLAVEALVSQDPRYTAQLKRTFGKGRTDLRYPFLSKDTHTILQTYWIYKYLYLQ